MKLIGLNTYLLTFKSRSKMAERIKNLRSIGTVTEVFVNNGFACEYRKHRRAK